MQRSKKIVFFIPSFSSIEATAPLGLLAISTPLLRAGYQIRIIDSTITPNFQKRVLEELSDALCLAVSLVTGPMIRETVQIARAAKALYPDLPVVLGGWHPSLLPDQTLAAECVDIVIRGQGEGSRAARRAGQRRQCRVSLPRSPEHRRPSVRPGEPEPAAQRGTGSVPTNHPSTLV